MQHPTNTMQDNLAYMEGADLVYPILVGIYDKKGSQASRAITILEKNKSPLWQCIKYFEGWTLSQLVTIRAQVIVMNTSELSKKKAKRVYGQIDNVLSRPDLKDDYKEFHDFMIAIMGGSEPETIRVFTMTKKMVQEIKGVFEPKYESQ